MVSIKNVLCPIDFSEFSRHAFDRAVAIAQTHGAAVTAIHVVQAQAPPPFIPYGASGSLDAFTLSPSDREHLAKELAAFVAHEPPVNVPIAHKVIDGFSIAREIVTEAAALSADLIVMGTHGRTGFQRFLLGSVTERVLRAAPCPVLTVGEAEARVRGDAATFKRILCAVDFSECSIAALDFAVALAEPAKSEITAVNVIEWTPVGYDPLVGPPTDLAGYRMAAEVISRDRLHTVVQQAAHGTTTIAEIVSAGKPYHEILRIAEQYKSDLIVLGIHGRNPIDRMLFGSTAEPLVRRATCPVLTVRAKPAVAAVAA
ncbi:MAG TPA: universal stress protein [Vicinamibacterales bacterium]|nr:universal stress protein [Vicinamibacterales bacterium]